MKNWVILVLMVLFCIIAVITLTNDGYYGGTINDGDIGPINNRDNDNDCNYMTIIVIRARECVGTQER